MKINTRLIRCIFGLSYTASGMAHNAPRGISIFLVSSPRNSNQSCVINTLSILSLVFRNTLKNNIASDQRYKTQRADLFWFLETGLRKLEKIYTQTQCVLAVRTIWLHIWFSLVLSQCVCFAYSIFLITSNNNWIWPLFSAKNGLSCSPLILLFTFLELSFLCNTS